MKIRRIILFLIFIFMFANTYSDYYDNYYGSIAIDPDTGATGYSWDYSTRGGAEGSALNSCNGNCVVAVWFSNQCGSVSWSPSTGAYAWGTSRSSYTAGTTANGYCGEDDCRVVAAVCTTWYE